MTYSIIAFDRSTGTTGVATITGSVSVGAFVPHCRAGVGAIATQGDRTNWLYGERGLRTLTQTQSAQKTLDLLLKEDEGKHHRQCGVIDANGTIASWTGKECEDFSETSQGDSVIAIGNLLLQPGVTSAMLSAFEETKALPLAERFLSALHAGTAVGGDSRGLISGAICIDSFDQPPINVRVDYAPNRVLENISLLLVQYKTGEFKKFYDAIPTRKNYSKFKADPK